MFVQKVWIEEGPRKEMLPCTRLRYLFLFFLVNEELLELKLVTHKILINLNSLLEICVVIFEYWFIFVAEKIILCWVENEVFSRLFVPTSFFVLSKNVLLLALQNQRKLVNSLSPGACPSLTEWLINFYYHLLCLGMFILLKLHRLEGGWLVWQDLNRM